MPAHFAGCKERLVFSNNLDYYRKNKLTKLKLDRNKNRFQ